MSVVVKRITTFLLLALCLDWLVADAAAAQPGLVQAEAAQAGIDDCGEISVPRDAGLIGMSFLVDSEGLSVGQVKPETSAERAGLKPGDLITEINGSSLVFPDNLEALRWLLERFKAGETLSTKVLRNGIESNVTFLADSMTCDQARWFSDLFENSGVGDFESCAVGEESFEKTLTGFNPAIEEGKDAVSFFKRFTAGKTVVHVSPSTEQSDVLIVSDPPLTTGPLELDSLPEYMRELVAGLRSGETASFAITRVGDSSVSGSSIETLLIPDRLRPTN